MTRARGRACGALFAAIGLVAATDAARAGVVQVIELFTSQGCSQCPAADRLAAELARRPDTVVLSLPVTLWDYTGWKDTLASAALTRRQHAYARTRGDNLVYTPQAVVDGLAAEPGNDKGAILRAATSSKGADGAMSVPMQLSETDGRLHVDVGPGERPGQRPVGIYVLRVARTRTVAIGRGENSGRNVTYTNVVRAMNRIGDWTGQAAHFDLLALKGEDEGFVTLLQAGPPDHPGAILAAAKTPDL